MWADQCLDRLEIVVAAEQILERRIERAAMAAEIKDPAVVASLENQNFQPASDRACGADRHQICFGAGIGEPHQLDRREAGTDRRREARLGRVVSAKIEAAFERLLDRPPDYGMRMAKHPGGELAEEIDVFVPVEIP